jgi:MFS-type transporter involved in bile tolerance (Atg22 family)
LVLLFVTALIELFVVAFASAGFDEVADASPFGHPGTTVAGLAITVIALVGALAAWRGRTGPLRTIVAVAVFTSVGVVAVMALFFVVAGGTPIILAVLLALAAVEIAMIGRAVLQTGS